MGNSSPTRNESIISDDSNLSYSLFDHHKNENIRNSTFFHADRHHSLDTGRSFMHFTSIYRKEDDTTVTNLDNFLGITNLVENVKKDSHQVRVLPKSPQSNQKKRYM